MKEKGGEENQHFCPHQDRVENGPSRPFIRIAFESKDKCLLRVRRVVSRSLSSTVLVTQTSFYRDARPIKRVRSGSAAKCKARRMY